MTNERSDDASEEPDEAPEGSYESDVTQAREIAELTGLLLAGEVDLVRVDHIPHARYRVVGDRIEIKKKIRKPDMPFVIIVAVHEWRIRADHYPWQPRRGERSPAATAERQVVEWWIDDTLRFMDLWDRHDGAISLIAHELGVPEVVVSLRYDYLPTYERRALEMLLDEYRSITAG